MIGAHDHPQAFGGNHGEAQASHNEKLHNSHGTPAPASALHAEKDRQAAGHAPRGVQIGAKGCLNCTPSGCRHAGKG
jgi:hypothetical protein